MRRGPDSIPGIKRGEADSKLVERGLFATEIRRKIEPNPSEPRVIRTVRGAGYLFSPDGRDA